MSRVGPSWILLGQFYFRWSTRSIARDAERHFRATAGA